MNELAALLGGAALIAYLLQRYLKVVPLVGFLVTGVLLGPHALGLVRDIEVVEGAAEVGVILLLFTIGIEFSLERLARIQRLIFGGGGLQVLLTTALVTVCVVVAGGTWQAGVFTGFLVSLSSTVIVLKLLGDRGKSGTLLGQASLGVLLFQDLAVVVMVLLVPVLAGSTVAGSAVALALAKAAVIIAIVLLLARRVMPPFLERVARTCEPDIFLLTVVGVCFGTAWLTSLAGVSVSLGAFLAGLIVSESRFSLHALSEMLPLRILFSAVFFVSVGMLLDPAFVLDNAGSIAVVIAAVVALKAVATTVSLRLMGAPLAVAGASGVLLAQVGEFTFVLEHAGRELGLFPGGVAAGSQAFIAATVVLMATTPLLAQFAWRAVARDRSSEARSTSSAVSGEPDRQLVAHTIVAGYGVHAQRLVPVLRGADLPHVVITLNPDGASAAQQAGSTTLFGDYTRLSILEAARVEHARALIIADDDLAMTERVVSVARMLNEDLIIIALAQKADDADTLRAAGATRVVVVEGSVDRALLDHAFAAHAADGTSPTTAVAVTSCQHLDQVRVVRPRTPHGCEECLQSGSRWTHLRLCMTCGHVGCCDTSPNRHATRHFQESGHPIIQSAEPGETWGWCYVDRIEVTL